MPAPDYCVPFCIIGATPEELREQADTLEGLLDGFAWALVRGHLSHNPTIKAACKQIRMRRDFLRQLVLDAEKPINEVAI